MAHQLKSWEEFVSAKSIDTIGGSEKIIVSDSGTTKYVTPDVLKTYSAADATIMHLSGSETVTGVKKFNIGSFLDKGNSVYDVHAYDAVGDGSTNDKLAIQAAVDAADAAGGGLVLLRNPSYFTATPIELKDNVCIGSYTKSQLTSTMTSSSERGVINITGQNNVGIYNIKIKPDGGSTAITSYGHDTLFIENVEITGDTTSANSPIQLSGGSTGATGTFKNTYINKLYIHDMANCDNAIRLYARNNHTIDNTHITNSRFVNMKRLMVMLDCYDNITNTYVHHNKFQDISGDTTFPGLAVWTRIGEDYFVDGLFVHDNEYTNTLTTVGHSQSFMQWYTCKNTQVHSNKIIGSWTVDENTIGPAFAPGRVEQPNINTVIRDNFIQGFDAAWDPDSQINTEVTGNIIYRCGQDMSPGYGLQDNTYIHHNIFYNSPAQSPVNALVSPGASTSREKNCRVEYNTYIDDRPIATPTGLATSVLSGGSLAGSTTYYYKVTAHDNTGETLASLEASGITTGSNKRIKLTWNHVPGADGGYTVYRTTSTGSYGATSKLVTTKFYTYTDTGAVSLSAGTPPGASTVQDCGTDYAAYFHNSTPGHGDTVFRGNRFFVPNSTFTSIFVKGDPSSIYPRLVEDNQFIDSAGTYLYAENSLGSKSGTVTFDRADGEYIKLTQTGHITGDVADGVYIGEKMTRKFIMGGAGAYTYTKDTNEKLLSGSFTPSGTVGDISILTQEWDGSYWVETNRSVGLS